MKVSAAFQSPFEGHAVKRGAPWALQGHLLESYPLRNMRLMLEHTHVVITRFDLIKQVASL